MSSVTLPGTAAGLALCIVLAALLLCAACTSTGPSPAAPPGFASDLEKITSQPQYEHAIWGIIVVDPATGKTLYEKNADQLFVPASSTKLFSSAAVLEALGPGYRFTTPVYAAGAVDAEGALDGSLVLVATGDPEMGGRTLPDGTVEFMDSDHSESHALLTTTDPVAGLDDLARQVKTSGISSARDVVIDDRLFAKFAMENVGTVSPIVVNDNMVDVIVTAGTPGSAPVVTMRPQSPLYRIENTATTGPTGSASTLEVGEGAAGTIIVAGTIPAGTGTLNQSVHVTDPAAFARSLFIGSLRKQGVNVTAPATGDNPVAKLPAVGSYTGSKKVASLTSPTLAEDVKLTLKVSQNYHANHYIMLLALADNRTSFYDGMDKEGRVLQSIGFDTKQVMLSDGAGGDRVNHVTPRAAAQLLTLVSKRAYAGEYIKAQPILGVDGSTVHHCRAGNPACGKVYAKTGTFTIPDYLNGRSVLTAKALAGYVDTKSGSRRVFAVYVNNVPLSDTVTQDTVGTDLGSIAGLVYQYY